MLGADARGCIGLQLSARKAGSVAVGPLSRIRGQRQLFQYGLPRGQHVGITHHLAQAQYAGMRHKRGHVCGGEIRAVCFKGGSGHAGGQHQVHVQRQVFRCIQQILYGLCTAYVDDLMRVGHNGGGAAAGSGAGEFKGRGKAGFDVDVRVDETRTQEFVRAVQFCPSPVASHARNHAARHRHVCSDDLLGKNIDHVDVFEHEVGGARPAATSMHALSAFIVRPPFLFLVFTSILHYIKNEKGSGTFAQAGRSALPRQKQKPAFSGLSALHPVKFFVRSGMAASERGLEPPGQPHQQCGIPAVIIRPPGLFRRACHREDGCTAGCGDMRVHTRS